MKRTPSNKTKSSSSRGPDTIGIVVDMHNAEGRELAQETVRETDDPELRNLISMAQALGIRYLIAAGKFDGKGLSATLCDDEQSLISGFQIVNARMREIGSDTTGWMFKPDACMTLLEKAIAQRVAKNKRGQR